MEQVKKHNRLEPWFIGIGIVVLADLFVAYRMLATECPAPGFVECLVVLVIPAVYLGLMYLTLKSQEWAAESMPFRSLLPTLLLEPSQATAVGVPRPCLPRDPLERP